MKVLIVDDLVINRFYLKQTLKGLGHQVTEASDGLKAVNLLKDNKFDVVFMDIEMPVMNGFEAILLIRQTAQLSDLKVIAITSHDAALDGHSVAFEKFNGCITKPLSSEKLKKYLS
jgi:CheY-like chemotaxis protein